MALIHDNSYFLPKTRPPAEAPPPRRAHAASPSPSCSGKQPKVERWRGVNGLVLTIVGRGPLCPVLPEKTNTDSRYYC